MNHSKKHHEHITLRKVDSDEDYYDIQTHAIDDYKLCELKRKKEQALQEEK